MNQSTLRMMLPVLLTAACQSAPGTISDRAGSREKQLHLNFSRQLAEFENSQVDAFWRCLFGQGSSAHKFGTREALDNALEAALFSDPKAFPRHVTEQCLPKALQAAKLIPSFAPPAPAQYDSQLTEYGHTLMALGDTLNQWAASVPQRLDAQQRQKTLLTAAEAWSTTANPDKAAPDAWRYHNFLFCAVPELDKIKDQQALGERLSSSCVAMRGPGAAGDFLTKVRDTCLPAAQEVPDKAPTGFKRTFRKFAPDADRQLQVWRDCFRQLNKETQGASLEGFSNAWEQSRNVSSRLHKLNQDLISGK